MVTEKTSLSLHKSWHQQQQGTAIFSPREKSTIVTTPPKETLLLKYSLFTFYLLRRAMKAGLLIAREEFLLFFRER